MHSYPTSRNGALDFKSRGNVQIRLPALKSAAIKSHPSQNNTWLIKYTLIVQSVSKYFVYAFPSLLTIPITSNHIQSGPFGLCLSSTPTISKMPLRDSRLSIPLPQFVVQTQSFPPLPPRNKMPLPSPQTPALIDK